MHLSEFIFFQKVTGILSVVFAYPQIIGKQSSPNIPNKSIKYEN